MDPFQAFLDRPTYTSGITPTATESGGFFKSIGSILLRALLIIVIVLIILIFIHYTIRPIFKKTPDDPGIIQMPTITGADKVFWKNKSDVSALDVAKTPLGSSTSGNNYSLCVDIEIADGYKYTGLPRIIFYKGTDLATIPNEQRERASVASMIRGGSLVFALTRDTNDLQVGIITANNNLEGVLLYNVPIRKPFRVGVIVTDTRLEVYTNGRLSRTRKLSATPAAISGKFWPSSLGGIELRNLHIWPHVITSQEMRAAIPALASGSLDNAPSQETSSCDAAVSAVTALTNITPD
jgi:hypothetical protein